VAFVSFIDLLFVESNIGWELGSWIHLEDTNEVEIEPNAEEVFEMTK
jgi:hypothetical protein